MKRTLTAITDRATDIMDTVQLITGRPITGPVMPITAARIGGTATGTATTTGKTKGPGTRFRAFLSAADGGGIIGRDRSSAAPPFRNFRISLDGGVETGISRFGPAPFEGRFAIVTDVGCGMRWTRAALLTRALTLRTAKSCGPDAPTLASSLRKTNPLMTVANKPGHRGEHEGNR
jgi:hypothetical protein